MRVLDVYETEGVSINNGKKNKWTSLTAVCLDYFKGKDGEGEYIRCFKLNKNVAIPDSETDVKPLFDERGRVDDFKLLSEDE